MRIKSNALQLLEERKISELLALEYSQLLPESVLQELSNMFLTDDFIDTTQSELRDCVTLKNIKDACVVSSGHIYSKLEVEALAARAGASNDIICPLSREILTKNLYNNQAYVVLPRINSIIQCAQLLHSMHQAELSTSSREEKKEEISVTQEQHAKLELRASNGRVKIYFTFHPSAVRHIKFLSDYLEFSLPKGRIQSHWNTYSLSTECFSRGWSLNSSQLMLNFWYPMQNSNPTSRRTFSETHLNKIMQTFSNICHLPLQEVETDANAAYTLSNLNSKEYIVLMQDISVSSKQMFFCLYHFLTYTSRIANALNLPVIDEVKVSHQTAGPSRVLGPGHFGSQHNILTSSSHTQSYSVPR